MQDRITKALVMFACSLEGLGLGFFAGISLNFFDIHPPRFVLIALAILGAIGGCVLGLYLHGPSGRGKTVAWWCHWMAWIVGVMSFLVGFIGPILLQPDSPQGPLFGIFATGPLGAVAGAVIGVIIGLWMARGLPKSTNDTGIGEL